MNQKLDELKAELIGKLNQFNGDHTLSVTIDRDRKTTKKSVLRKINYINRHLK